MADRVETFSDEALAILNAMPLDPDATYSYEHLSGGFIWTDEFPPIRSAEWKIVRHDYIYRFLINMRRSITLGDTSFESTPLWQQMVNDSPNWPGLLPERRTGRIVNRLLAAERLAHRCYETMEDECDGDTQRGAAGKHGFYARPSAHLGSLATGHGFGTIFRSSGIARFVKSGVVKTFR